MRGKRLLLAALLGLGSATAPASTGELEEVKALVANGHTERALDRLESFLTRQPTHVEGQFLRGVLLVEEHRVVDAERAFLILSRQVPERPEPINNLAVLRAAGGKRAFAIAALEEIVTYYPSYEAAAINLERIRSGLAGASYDPMDPDDSQIQLVLTAELGSYSLVEPPAPEPLPLADPAAPVGSEAAPRLTPEPVPTAPEPAPPEPDTVTTRLKPATALKPDTGPTSLAREPVVPAPAETANESGAETVAATAPPNGDLRAALKRVVEAWVEAWSQQRIREYLDFYAADFRATGYPSREAWETVRRQRVAAPAFIEVEVDLETMTVSQTGANQASVTFTQHYRSDRFGDTVEKTLELVREDGLWRIRRETSG